MKAKAIARPRPIAGAHASSVTQAMIALLLGLFLVWGVGFSPIMSVHNATHDTRHSSGFPCH